MVPATDENELYSQLRDITTLHLVRDSVKYIALHGVIAL